jgi:low affinity Fe/Cu permease
LSRGAELAPLHAVQATSTPALHASAQAARDVPADVTNPPDDAGRGPRDPNSSPASHHDDGSAQGWFRRFAHRVSVIVGKAGAFCAALALIIIWGATGPLFGFSDTWQLVINTSTTIVTFLMVFLIQSTQNRDACAIHLKLDELIRATHSARNGMLALEQLSDERLEDLEREFERLRDVAQRKRASRAPQRPLTRQSPE